MKGLKAGKKINIMEVCGTHTMAIARYGLKSLLPGSVKMLSGPGCPVCVTTVEDIDKAIEISKKGDTIITTFGDMLKVPGSSSSLEKEKAGGADIRIVYSPMDALELAEANPSKKVVFLGAGFETTAPLVAATLMSAIKRKISNFFVLSMFKTMPAALEAILKIKERRIDGFLLPGHVSAIIGSKPYVFVARKYKVPCVIGGFEAKDIIDSVAMLVEQIRLKKPSVQIQYSRVVKEQGNIDAQLILKEVFKPSNSRWRGIGNIPGSGLVLRSSYKRFDAEGYFDVGTNTRIKPSGCKCGDILLGIKSPSECPLFAKRCVPEDPVGPCMVSSEGACAAEYKYGKGQRS